VQAVLDGIEKRAAAGKTTIFIHTSGTSVLEDHANGAFKSNEIYDDTDADAINRSS
jgi:hypothetical protein